jgi:hypothetical protein
VKKLFLLIFIFCGLFYLTCEASLFKVKSTPVSNLRDQLSSAQLSYFGRLNIGTSAGSSLITIITDSGSAPSNNNYNLFIGDTLAIANATTGSTNYVVSDTTGTNGIFLSTVIDNLNAFEGAYVVATRSAIHTISFSPPSSITAGKWQVLIKATSTSGENNSDGMPDQNGFDIHGLLSTDVTCPWGATASVGTTTVVSSNSYHLITCALPTGGTNPIGTGTTGTIIIGGTNKLINPSPTVNHVIGQANASADTYTFIVRHVDTSNTVIDNETTFGKIALTESVKVTATIDPTITFYIDAVGTSTPGLTRCGATLSSGASQSTATAVNFGSISLGQFNTLAQRFTCSTNAVSGYTVQIFENSPLTVTTLGTNTTIPDTDCDDASPCSLNTATNWSTDTNSSQFGYSLESISSSPVAFEAGASFAAKPFGRGFANTRTVMSRTSTPPTDDRAYICYRITASNFQEAGTYQNQINFIATATF